MENKRCYVLLLVALLQWGCYKEKNVPQDQVILRAGHLPVATAADGVSKVLISVEINPAATDASNSVLLTTTKGLFDIVAKNTVTLVAQSVLGANGENHKIATVNLVSTTDTVPAIITATVKNFSRLDTVLFARAYPTLLRVTTDKLIYLPASNGEVTVTVNVRREVGMGVPTLGQFITLEALDQNNVAIGNFRNKTVVTDAAGNCVNFFSMPTPNSYVGIVKFRTTTVKDAAGNLLTDSTIINIR